MNNGLQGRYQEQLARWNEARFIAGKALSAYKNGGSIDNVLSEHDLIGMLKAVKKKLMKFVSCGHQHVNDVAREIYYETTEYSEYPSF